MLTNAELKQIKDYLLLYGKKDSQLDSLETYSLDQDDYLSIIKEGKNRTVTIEQLENTFLKTFLNDPAYEETWEGAIDTPKLEDGAITTEKMANLAVIAQKITNGAITTDKIANGAITNEKIANNTIQGAAFAENSITTDKIVDGTVTGDKLADGSIQSVDIKDNTLSGSKFVDDSINGSKIQDDAIESKHLLDNSIPASKIKDGSIESVDIKDGTLDGAKIKDNTIESSKLANNAITTDKIIDNNITTSKIANDAVTEDKIVDDSITTNKIANSSVTTDKIVDEAITEDKLANGAVTTAKLADGLISEIQNITDATPTTGSVKPVQSGGVKTAIDNVAFLTNEKVKEVGIDDEPTAESDNLVKSGYFYNENLKHQGALNLGLDIKIGSIDSTTGNNVTSTTRVRTSGYLSAPFHIKVDSNYRLRGFFKYQKSLDGNYVYVNYTSQSSTEYNFKNTDYYYRIIINKVPDTQTISPSELHNIIQEFENSTEYVKQQSIKDNVTLKDFIVKDQGANNLGLSVEPNTIDSNGNNASDNTRARSVGYITAPFTIKTNSGYQVRGLHRYTEVDGTIIHIDYQSKYSTNFSITNTDYIYRLVLNKIPDDTQVISEEDANNSVKTFINSTEYIKRNIVPFTKEQSDDYKDTKIKLQNCNNLGLSVELHSIDSGTGNNDNTVNNRARTTGYITAPFNLKVNSGYRIRVLYKYSINNDGSYVYSSYQSSTRSEYDITDKNYVYRVTFCKVDDTQNIVESDLQDIVLSFTNSTEYIRTKQIPQLQNQVSGYDSKFRDIQGCMNMGLDLAVGTLDGDTGLESASTTRARTVGYITAPFKITTNTGFLNRILFKYTQNSDGTYTFVGRTTNATREWNIIDKRYVYKIVFNKSDDTQTISTSDLPNIIQKFINSDTYVKDVVTENDSAIYLKKLSGKSSNVSAHYGGNLLADYNSPSGVNELIFPEYSQYTLILGKRAGFDIIGMNLKLTKDKNVVCLHDNTLNRTFRNASDYSVISSDVNVASLTLAEIQTGYVNNTQIERLRLPILTFEDAIITAKNLNVGIVCLCDQFCFPYAWDLLKKYGVRESGFLLSSRPKGYDGLIIVAESTKKTKEQIMELLYGVGKPACFMMDQSVALYTTEELLDISEEIHRNGFLLSASLWNGKAQFNRLLQIGAFDFSNVDNEIPEFAVGDVTNVKSIEDFSDFSCSSQSVQDSGNMNVNDTISYTATNYPKMSGVCLKIHFKGELQLIFGNRYAEADNVIINSDGGVYSIFTNVFYNVAPNFTIKATAVTEVYDIDVAINKII